MSKIYEMDNIPAVEEYVKGLRLLGNQVTNEHKQLFKVHYDSPQRTATAKQLVELASVNGGVVVVNSRYGKLGHAFCDIMSIQPDPRSDETNRWWAVWSRGWQTPGGFVWQMYDNFASALEKLGWVNGEGWPGEVLDASKYYEGAVRQVTINAYERDKAARDKCIQIHGHSCCICGMSFGATYGADVDGFIHVHHLIPLSTIGQEYQVDPLNDLRPVCPNCHAVLHLGGRARTIDEVKQMLSSKAVPSAAIPSGS